MKKINFLYVAWVISAVATGGSFFLSQVLDLPPCDLCWYQRIFMFPLVILLAVGFSRDDRSAFAYSFPLVVIGLLIAAYHNLLYYGVIPKALSPCVGGGVSCTDRQLDLFGFISIPLMSFVGFFILLVLLLLHNQQLSDEALNEEKK